MRPINLKKNILCFSIFAFIFTSGLFADTSYKVQKGDTLYSISRKYQITVAELRAANNLSENDVLQAGQKLVIPDADIGNAAALSQTKTNGQTLNAEQTKTVNYKVQKGETLYRIAKNNGITVADLLSINNFDNSVVIKEGQTIKVPAEKGSVSTGFASGSTSPASNTGSKTSYSKSVSSSVNTKQETLATATTSEPAPDTRTYGSTVTADSSTKWPVKNPKITQIKGKVSGVQLSAKENESVLCIHEGTVMYVGTYRGFGQVVFVQSKTGLIYAYTGLGSVKVHKGDYAVADSELGTAGIDSISGKSQIIFMVFQNGQPINPASAPRS